MSLKFMLENLEGLDESIAALYTKHDDGKFYLEVDGAVAKTKLDEFRDNNIDLLKKLEPFKGLDPKQVEDMKKIDPAKYAEMIEKLAALDKDKTIPADEVERIISERVLEMSTEHGTAVKGFQSTIDTQNRQLEGLVIDSAVRKASAAGKVLSTAVDDVLLRAKSVFIVKDGAAVAQDASGQTIYGKDGTNPMQIGEWIGKLSKEASHLFEGSQGGGGQGGGGGGGKHLGDNSKMSPAQKIAAGLEEQSM